MTTFYGESYSVADLTNIVGSSVLRSRVFYHHDGLSSTVTSGDEFMVGVPTDSVDFAALSAATDIAISWVIETGPASSGTLSVASGLDPANTATNPALATEALGSQSASGTQTLVFGPVSGITHADIVGSAESVALITCTAGTVEVVQVKLRVWPSAGMGGNWAIGAPWETFSDRQLYASEPNEEETPQVDGYALAWSAGRANVDALEGTDKAFLAVADSSASSRFDLSHSVTIPPFQEFANTALTVLILSAVRPNISHVGPGVTAGYDPREIQYEDDAQFRGIGGGPIIATFLGWTGDSAVTIDGVGEIGLEAIAAPAFVPHPTLSGWLQAPMPVPTPDGVTRAAGDTTPILAAEHQVLGVFAPNYFANPGTASVSGVTGEFTLGLDFFSVWQVPPYEYWDPDAPAAAPRFFVKDLDGDWRPAGFGKPADETAVFKVPTAVGFYRDLTTAEYASHGPDSRPTDGHPLKVKRLNDDGSTWWDHVAWMVPDA